MAAASDIIARFPIASDVTKWSGEKLAAQIKKMFASYKGYTTGLSNKINIAELLLRDASKAPPSQIFYEQIDIARRAVRDVLARNLAFLEAIRKYNGHIVDGDETSNAIDDKENTDSQRAHIIMNGCLLAMANIEAELKPKPKPHDRTINDDDDEDVALGGGAGGAGNNHRGRWKAESDLKPMKLAKDASALEYRKWLQDFRDYYEASQFAVAPLGTQRAYLRHCLSPEIDAMLAKDVTRDTDVVEDENLTNTEKCCLDYLTEYFLKEKPLVTRRLAYFKALPKKGQIYSEFVRTLDQMGDEAHIQSCTWDDTAVMRRICACPDNELVRRMLQVKVPTMETIDEAISNYETETITMGEIDNLDKSNSGAQAFAAKTGKGKKKGGGEPSKPPANASSSSNSSDQFLDFLEKKKKQGLCYKCNQRWSDGHQCSAKNHTCENCGKKGHVASCCNSKPAGAAARQVEAEAPPMSYAAAAQGGSRD